MKVGVVTEIKPAEQRVALTPGGARELVRAGHQALVEPGAGVASGYPDEMYAAAGATLCTREEVWATSELLVKVKEPVDSEYSLLHSDLTLFTYLHLAADFSLTEALLEAGTCAIAYETVEEEDGHLPLLAPMSEIAGRLAVQAGAYFLQGPQGGKGLLVGGAPGVLAARVVIIGGGVAGTNAARVAVGMGAEVTILELSPRRVRALDELFETQARVLTSDSDTLEKELAAADIVIGAVLLPGARAPRLIDHGMLDRMDPGTVFVDVAIDQGGCAETSRPTTYEAPTYREHDIVHYCAANMPGAVPATSTRALTNATFPYVRRLAAHGVSDALSSDPALGAGVNIRGGSMVNGPVAEAHAIMNRGVMSGPGLRSVEALRTALDTLVEAFAARAPHSPSLMLRVEVAQLDLEYEKVVGTQYLGGPPVPARCAYACASEGKAFVAAACMRLVERNDLALDDPLV